MLCQQSLEPPFARAVRISHPNKDTSGCLPDSNKGVALTGLHSNVGGLGGLLSVRQSGLNVNRNGKVPVDFDASYTHSK